MHGRGGPLPRCCHSMTRVPAQDVIVLHGGLSRVDGNPSPNPNPSRDAVSVHSAHPI